MTTLDKTADQIVADIVKSGVWLTIPQRKVVWALIVGKVRPMVVEQAKFHFTEADENTNDAQCHRILALLKERRSRGATNVELSAIALKYTSRISQLRQAPYNFQINCTREEGRVTRYNLYPTDW